MRLKPWALIVLSGVSVLAGVSAWAVMTDEEYKALQRDRDAAYAKYLDTLKNTPKLSPSDVDLLRQQMVGPADKKLLEAERDFLRKKAVNPSVQTEDGRVLDLNKPADYHEGERLLKEELEDSSPDETIKVGGDSKVIPANDPKAPSTGGGKRPEYIIDGSNIPKEVEFPGSPSPTPKPKKTGK